MNSAIKLTVDDISRSVQGLLGLGVTVFIMLLLGNLYIRKKAIGVARVAANKATFNATLVLAIMVGLWALVMMTDRLFADSAAQATAKLPF